jgi:hypothetical protein
MHRDPIVEEVHRVRAQMWDECGGNLDRLIESLRASEARHPDLLITADELKQMRAMQPPPASAHQAPLRAMASPG